MKRNKLIILTSVVFFVLGSITYLPLYLRNKEIADLMHQGNDLVEKIEAYKLLHNKIPDSLEDMGLNLPDNYPLSYNSTQGNGNYVISFPSGLWFGSGFFQSKAYRSDSKKWADIN